MGVAAHPNHASEADRDLVHPRAADRDRLTRRQAATHAMPTERADRQGRGTDCFVTGLFTHIQRLARLL
jgi:hypothetical protein